MKKPVTIFYLVLAGAVALIVVLTYNPPRATPTQAKPNNAALVEAAEKARVYTAKDFTYGKDSVPLQYRDVVVEGVNRIHQQDSRCAYIDPIDVFISPYAKPDKPVFTVLCGKVPDTHVVTFTPEDVASGKVFNAPAYYPTGKAIIECRDYARAAASYPETVTFDWQGYGTEHTDEGLTILSVAYTAKNGFGVSGHLGAKCTFNTTGMISAKTFRLQ